jgi:hypothetical protein
MVLVYSDHFHCRSYGQNWVHVKSKWGIILPYAWLAAGDVRRSISRWTAPPKADLLFSHHESRRIISVL